MKKKLLAALGVVLLAVAVILVFPTGIERSLVEAQLKNFGNRLEQLARMNGRQATFSYEDIEIRGLLFSKSAVVTRPAISTQGIDKFGMPVTYVFAAPDMIIKSESRDFTRFSGAIAGPVNIAMNTANVANVTLDRPLAAQIERAGVQSKAEDIYVTIPAIISIAPIESPADKATVTFAAPPYIESKTGEDGNIKEARLIAEKMLAQGPVTTDRFAFERLQLSMVNNAPDAKSRTLAYEAVVKNLELPQHVHPYGPANIIARYELTGGLPDNVSSPAAWVGKEVQLNIKEASINVKEFGLNLTGQVDTHMLDMPSWDAKLHVRNFPTFFHEMKVQTRMTEPQKAQLDEVFASVNGKKPSGKEDVLIAIHRQKGQPAMVGNITFDRFLELLKLASGN